MSSILISGPHIIPSDSYNIPHSPSPRCQFGSPKVPCLGRRGTVNGPTELASCLRILITTCTQMPAYGAACALHSTAHHHPVPHFHLGNMEYRHLEANWAAPYGQLCGKATCFDIAFYRHVPDIQVDHDPLRTRRSSEPTSSLGWFVCSCSITQQSTDGDRPVVCLCDHPLPW